MYMYMHGKNNNGLVYRRLINATVLYLLTNVLYTAHSTFYVRHSITFVLDPPTQNTISSITVSPS